MSPTWARRVSGFFMAGSPVVPNLRRFYRERRAAIHSELVSYRLQIYVTALAIDEIQVPQIDEEPEPLSDDEHRVPLDERIGKEHHAAADREERERDRKHALARALGRDPLHHEAHPEQDLADVAYQHHPVLIDEKNVEHIVVDAVRDINEHR